MLVDKKFLTELPSGDLVAEASTINWRGHEPLRVYSSSESKLFRFSKNVYDREEIVAWEFYDDTGRMLTLFND